jgi:hypothetical protein
MMHIESRRFWTGFGLFLTVRTGGKARSEGSFPVLDTAYVTKSCLFHHHCLCLSSRLFFSDDFEDVAQMQMPSSTLLSSDSQGIHPPSIVLSGTRPWFGNSLPLS